MKSLLEFVLQLTDEIGQLNGVSTLRDQQTITERYEHEGISFLTITLPQFARDFERSLDENVVDPIRFAGFSKSGPLPRFLGGLVGLVFDDKTGEMLQKPSIPAIRGIRQITLMMSKLLLSCSPERVSKAFDNYLEIEKEVRESDARVMQPDILGFSHKLLTSYTEASQLASRTHSIMVNSFPHMDLDPTWINVVETRSGFIIVGPNGVKHTFLSASMRSRVGWTILTVYPSPKFGMTYQTLLYKRKMSVSIVADSPSEDDFTMHVISNSLPRSTKSL